MRQYYGTPLSVKHILTECLFYEKDRREAAGVSDTLSEALHPDNISRMVSFITKSNLINYLLSVTYVNNYFPATNHFLDALTTLINLYTITIIVYSKSNIITCRPSYSKLGTNYLESYFLNTFLT